ncbi:4-coumarate--CoA ligase 1-like [Haliotis rufescens]|uniref:4-coumarate--CoA ligase 1-like n=1 Tax=Haliotis rufescens TaxID=6454 RepID=UPI00201E8170|nr:4-coumarate--CoA ligase 1-like [Haliotis rufescens]
MAWKGKPIHLPCVSLGTFMTERFDQHGDRVAMVNSNTGHVMSYRQLSSTIRRLARGLSNLGFKRGDVLCIFSPNVIEYPIVFYAVASLGGVLQATNPLYNGDELKHTIDICKTKFLLTLPDMLPVVRQALAQAHGVQKVIVLGEAEGCVSFASLITPDISDAPISDQGIDPKNDVTAILFSSGTTGKPKAVQISHYAMTSNVLQLLEPGLLTEKDSYVSFLPFFHIYGLGPIISTGLYSGAKNVVMSRFDVHEYLRNIQEHKATVLHLVPPVMVLLTTLPTVRQYDLSSVHRVLCGAAPLSKDIEAKILKIFNIKHVSQGFGMTECQVTHLSLDVMHRFGSVGTVVAGTECKIVDLETGKSLPSNKDGEVYVRGPGLMKGYLSNPGATSAMYTEDGWMKTGDIGHVDDEGFLFIVDRLKELIKYKAFQVAPAELEDVLLSHPSVADVGVIGIPDVEAGELPKAFVVRKPGSMTTEQELQDFVKSKVSGTKRLRGGVTFLEEIPKSASGKILRRMLRDMEKNTRSKL